MLQWLPLRSKRHFPLDEPIKQGKKERKMLARQNKSSAQRSLSSEKDTSYAKDAALYPHLTLHQLQNAGTIDPVGAPIIFRPSCAPRFRLQKMVTLMRQDGRVERLFPGQIVKVLEASHTGPWLIDTGYPWLGRVEEGWRLRVWRDYLGDKALPEWRTRCLRAMESEARMSGVRLGGQNEIEHCEEAEEKDVEVVGEKVERKRVRGEGWTHICYLRSWYRGFFL